MPLTMQQVHNSILPIAQPNTKDEIRIQCPDCGDTKGHCYANSSKKVYTCHKCGAKGRIIGGGEPSLDKFDSIINEYAGKPINPRDPNVQGYLDKETKEKLIRNLPINRCLAEYLPPKNFTMDKPVASALAYLINRGVTETEIKKYDVRICIEKEGPYRDTVIFPIYDNYDRYKSAKIRYFVARKYNGDKPRYVNAPWPKDETVFGLFKIPTNEVVIVEGIFDALAISRIGFNVISMLGKKPTPQQLIEMAKGFRKSDMKVMVYMDDDAFDYAVDLKMKLDALSIDTGLISRTDSKDAADLYLVDGGKSLKRMLNEAFTHIQT